ncbi:MAG: hypothetical protein L3J31_08030, partial [Bacteroidales bacterium]|nr:hypothetical protein [Bacteroidales bacterium]
LFTGHSNIDGANVSFGGAESDTLFIHYPAWGADDGYGHWRSGDIKVSTGQGFFEPSSIVRFHFIDFFYDKDTLHIDSLQVQFLGQPDGQNGLFSVSSDTIHRIFSDTSGVNRFWMQQSFLRLKDASSPYHTPLDKFAISGWLNGESGEGVCYFTETSEEQPLLNQLNCTFLKQGSVAISFSSLNYEGNIYFSDPDTCENQYVVIFDESPFPYPIYARNW